MLTPKQTLTTLLALGLIVARPTRAEEDSVTVPGALMSPAGAVAASFDVRAFGAQGDGVNLDDVAIQAALDAAGNTGGGMVRVPAGTYRVRPLFLRSHVTLHLKAGAILIATGEPADFGILAGSPDARVLSLVNGDRLTDVAITGSGAIDGSGHAWWPAARAAKKAKKTEPPRPHLVRFDHCRNVTVTGVTLQNSPMFHLVPADCEDVVIRDLTINAPADSPNTDGIDPSASRRVTITGCRIDTGDDNIALKSGHLDADHPGAAACSNVVISDCTFLHGHGVSIGSETTGGVSDVLVQNCTFEDTLNGFRIKSARGRGGPVQKIRVRDVRMTNVDPAITITCYYPSIPTTDTTMPVTADTPVFSNIKVVNLQATCPRDAGLVIGLPESPVTNFSMKNVHITARSGINFRNVVAPQLTNVQVITSSNP